MELWSNFDGCSRSSDKVKSNIGGENEVCIEKRGISLGWSS